MDVTGLNFGVDRRYWNLTLYTLSGFIVQMMYSRCNTRHMNALQICLKFKVRLSQPQTDEHLAKEL